MSVSLYGSGNTVIQAQSTNYTTNFSTTSTSFVDVSGFSVSITPQSTTSKILVLVTTQIDANVGQYAAFLNLTRNGTTIGAGITGGSNVPCFGCMTSILNGSPGNGAVISKNYLDSPATTSALTYQIQLSAYRTGAGTAYMNTGFTTSNQNGSATMSSITVLEISGS